VRRRAKARNNQATVERLCCENVGLIYHVANKIAPTYKVDADDLVSYGFLGLHRAAEMFDQSRGLAFSTYACPKIRGAILDGLRDELPWSARTEKDRRKCQRVLAQVEATGATITDNELADRLGWSVERVRGARNTAKPAVLSPDVLLGHIEAGNRPL